MVRVEMVDHVGSGSPTWVCVGGGVGGVWSCHVFFIELGWNKSELVESLSW